MKKKIIIVVTIVLFTVIGVIGFLGVPKETCLKDGNYKSCYTDYYVYPYLYDYWDCNCRSVLSILSPILACVATPCGTDSKLDRENAYANMIEHLCKVKTKNSQKIKEYYKNLKLVNISSNDTDFICKEGTKIYLRL